MELLSTETSQVGTGLGVTSQPTSASCDRDVERFDNGIFDYTNNNNNSDSVEKERRREDEMMAIDAAMSPEMSDHQLSGACSVDSASPLTPNSSPRDHDASLVNDSYKIETSTPRKPDDSGDTDNANLADLTGSERSSAASDYGTPLNSYFPEAAASVYQQYSSLKTSPFPNSSMSSPVRGVAGPGNAMRCPPVREAVDPAKYITISGEPDGVKYACSKCGNIYKWRKSLNKHWKEKHDGEVPDPAAMGAAANRFVRLPTSVTAKRPSPSAFSGATRPTGVRGSLAAILPPLPGKSGSGLGLKQSPVNNRGWSQSESMVLQSQQLKTPTFADYKTSSSISASPFSVLAVDSVSNKERPVDLSGSTARLPSNDDYGSAVLDLSKRGVTPRLSQMSSIQDEPIDFSTKTTSHSVKNPTEFCHAALEMAHASGVAVTSLNCAQCRQKFTVPSKLNRHFADVHSDLLRTMAAGDASCGGSAQLLRYLTTEDALSREPIRCVVCGTSFYRRSAVAKHFDQEHVGLYPNPYQSYQVSAGDRNAGVSGQRRLTGVEQQVAGIGKQLRCGRCPFTTDSFAVLTRHNLRHSPRRPSNLLTPEMSRFIWSGVGVDSDDVKVAELQLLSGNAMNMDDVIGENTAIVIPQAPEDTARAVPSTATSSKPFRQTSSGGRSAGGGRSKRSELAGGSTASAETLLPFKCELCEYRARWPSEMTQHVKNHSDEKPYHCPQCTYRSKWKWDVVKHLKRCGGGGTASDVIDTTNLPTSSSSVATAATVAACQTAARRRRTSVRSLLIDVPPISSERGIASAIENLMQPSAATSALPSHPSSRDQLSNGPPNVMVVSSLMDTALDWTAAVQSVAEIPTTTVLVKPAEAASPTPAAAPPVVSLVNQGLHYCLQCSFVGHSPAELRRHLRVHSDEKPYSCRTCCYSSKWKCDLKKHLRAYNHVSGVPLAYGGHGRKPNSDWQTTKDGLDGDADMNGPTDDTEDTTGDTLDGGNQSETMSSVRHSFPAKTQRMPNGSNFGGITVGGRLRCRRCDFEAIDLTSFLQHKSTHAPARGDELGDASDQPESQAAAASARPMVNHHRRKSSKQVRVLPENKTDKYPNSIRAAACDDRAPNSNSIEPTDDVQVNIPGAVDGSKFWTSLGLRSKNDASCQQAAEVKESMTPAMDMTANSEQLVSVAEKTVAAGFQSPCDADVQQAVLDALTPSPASSSSDTDLEYVDADQPVDLCPRRDTRLDADDLTKPLTIVVQRITTTEADDSSGMSKRKRKLRTCEKCGYVTDNLTTLQRHVAKHGSAGRHRCTQCDYTVERQHILDYHIKNVHVTSSNDQGTVPLDHSDEELNLVDSEPFQTSSSTSPVKRRRTPGADTDQVMASYRCVCGYSGYSVGALARHRLRHSVWSLPHRCRQCPHRATTRRLLTQHIKSHDSRVPSACSQCPYKSSSTTQVAEHERFHGAGRRYHCPYCSYSLDSRQLLVQHRRIHDQDCKTTEQLRCPHANCPFTCYDRDQLVSHGRQHARTGRARPHVCDHCSFGVDSRNALLRHRRLHLRSQ